MSTDYIPNRAQRRALSGAAKRQGVSLKELTARAGALIAKGATFNRAIAIVTSKEKQA